MPDKKPASKKLLLVLLLAIAALAALLSLKRCAPSATLPVISIESQNGHRLIVDGKPYLIRGVCYSPVPVGKDYEYNFWGDPGKPWLLDGRLMKQMGVNTVRIYRSGKDPEEVNRVLSDLHSKYGIRALMGHYLGFWNWPPPNYADREFCDEVKAQVLEMVRMYKNNPGVLMWVLGNENNYSFDDNVQRWSTDEIDALPPEKQKEEKARIYYSFVNELAVEIKKIDPVHPVVMGVGETRSLEYAAQYAPDIDVIGMIAYRGPGFGNLFRQIQQKFDKPVVLTEFGADSYNAVTQKVDEDNQAEFLRLQWKDIERNADPKKGVGNCLGGTIFEWNDEWWKGNENLPHTWSVHETRGNWANASYHFDFGHPNNPNMNEEWWGVVGLDPDKTQGGLQQRVPKKAYRVLKELWTGQS